MTAVPRTPTVVALLAFSLALHAHPLRAADPAQLEFFENEVRPLLATHCYECHSVKSKSLKAGLRLDSRSALLKGGDSGPAFSTNKPETSLLLEAVRCITGASLALRNEDDQLTLNLNVTVNENP